MITRNTHRIVVALVVFGVILRLALFVANRPDNAYDDHWEPIEIMLMEGGLPKVEDCWECSQPPLFHLFGVLVFKAFAPLIHVPKNLYSMDMLKAIQTLSFVFGALTVIAGAWLVRSFLSGTTAVIAGIALLALLPRHVYLSAMLANDTLATLLTTLSLLPVISTRGGKPPSGSRVALVGILAGLAALAKGTALCLVPALGMWLLWWWREEGDTVGFMKRLAILSVGFMIGGGWHYLWRAVEYGNPFIKNMEVFTLIQEKGYTGIESFWPRPLALLKVPLLDQVTAGSIPTQLYARTWFDYEPWLSGGAAGITTWARVAYLLGAVPSLLIVFGLFTMVKRSLGEPKYLVLFVLFLSSITLVVVHSMTYRIYSSMKATYVLPSMAAVVVAFGIGTSEILRIMPSGWRSVIKGVLWLAAIGYVLQIVWIIVSVPGHPGL